MIFCSVSRKATYHNQRMARGTSGFDDQTEARTSHWSSITMGLRERTMEVMMKTAFLTICQELSLV